MFDKSTRILSIYTKLLNGNVINKANEAVNFGVNERSIQRDIDSIRAFFDELTVTTGEQNTIIYDHKEKGYKLEQISKIKLTNSEVLAVCKILLDSRAFTNDDMNSILDRLVSCCVPVENRELVEDLILNEKFHYIEPRHKTAFFDKLWNIGQAIKNNKYIEIDYLRTKDKAVVKRKLKPLAIMFSEYYFYLAAFIDDEEVRKDFDIENDSFPTIYRLDRIKNLKVLKEDFYIPYTDKFQEGEFRKRIQFMYGGKLQKVKFTYSGLDVDAVLDRLPTAKILSENEGVYSLEAEVFGKGIDMWFRSQGENINIVKENTYD